MSTIREKIKSQLELSERLHKAAEEVLKAKIADKGLHDKEISKVALKYDFTYAKLKQKVKILKEKKNYLALKNKIKRVVKEVKDVQCNKSIRYICERYELPPHLIFPERRKRLVHGHLYQYENL